MVRKVASVSWKTVCSPKEAGGLGLKSVKDINRAALLKLCWKLVSSDNQWVLLFKARVILNNKFSKLHISSSILQGLKPHIETVLSNCKWLIGDRAKTNFWVDCWLSRPVVELLQIPCNIHLLLHAKVKDFIRNGQWTIPDFMLQKSSVFATEIDQYVIRNASIPDELVCRNTNSGDLSLKDAYAMLWKYALTSVLVLMMSKRGISSSRTNTENPKLEGSNCKKRGKDQTNKYED